MEQLEEYRHYPPGHEPLSHYIHDKELIGNPKPIDTHLDKKQF